MKIENLYQVASDDIQAQYRNSNIKALIDGIVDIKTRYLKKGLESLQNDNLSLSTAKQDGLDMWGVLLHFSRYIPQDTSGTTGIQYFNFNNKNFVRLQFQNPNNPSYGTLTDDILRKMLLLIYQQMFIINTIPNINIFINNFFDGFDKIEVRDAFDMSYEIYVFYNDGTFPIWLKWIFDNYDVLPRPAGVGSRYIDRQPLRRFGFAPDGTTNPWYFENIGNFSNSNFAPLV